MAKHDPSTKHLVADKLMSLGNLAAGAFIFGYLLSEEPNSNLVIVFGLLTTAWLYAIAILYKNKKL